MGTSVLKICCGNHHDWINFRMYLFDQVSILHTEITKRLKRISLTKRTCLNIIFIKIFHHDC